VSLTDQRFGLAVFLPTDQVPWPRAAPAHRAPRTPFAKERPPRWLTRDWRSTYDLQQPARPVTATATLRTLNWEVRLIEQPRRISYSTTSRSRPVASHLAAVSILGNTELDAQGGALATAPSPFSSPLSPSRVDGAPRGVSGAAAPALDVGAVCAPRRRCEGRLRSPRIGCGPEQRTSEPTYKPIRHGGLRGPRLIEERDRSGGAAPEP